MDRQIRRTADSAQAGRNGRAGRSGVDVRGPSVADRQKRSSRLRPLELRRHARAPLRSRRRALLERRREVQAQLDAGWNARLPARDRRRSARGDWTVAPIPADLRDRRVEITGPVDRKMIINALNSRRQRLHGRLRGLQLADLEEPRRGPGEPERRGRRTIEFVSPRGQALPAERAHRDAHGAPARLAPRREARARRRRAGLGAPLRLRRSTSSTTRAELLARGTGPYFYLPKLESHLEARLWNDVFVAAQERAGHPARHDQGHGADRDDPRRVRDGRDPLGAARPLGRAQLRALGLHLQLHQEIPRAARLRAARPLRASRWTTALPAQSYTPAR